MWIKYGLLIAGLQIFSFILAIKGKENKYAVTVSLGMTSLLLFEFYKLCANAIETENFGYLVDVVPGSTPLIKTVLGLSLVLSGVNLAIRDVFNGH